MKNDSLFLKKSVWFFDIDSTLINSGDCLEGSANGVRVVFAENFDAEIGRKAYEEFIKIYKLVQSSDDLIPLKQQYEAVNNLLKEIAFYQKGVISKHRIPKKWSREVFIKIIAKRLGLAVSKTFIEEASSAYWSSLWKTSTVFPDALEILDFLHANAVPVFLLTGSGNHLRINEVGDFEYDAGYSEALRLAGIEKLRDLGLKFRIAIIGDPDDKPTVEFYRKGLEIASKNLDYKIDPKHCVMVGNSLKNDIETPRDVLGFGTTVLYQRDSIGLVSEGYGFYTTGDLALLKDISN